MTSKIYLEVTWSYLENRSLRKTDHFEINHMNNDSFTIDYRSDLFSKVNSEVTHLENRLFK